MGLYSYKINFRIDETDCEIKIYKGRKFISDEEAEKSAQLTLARLFGEKIIKIISVKKLKG